MVHAVQNLGYYMMVEVVEPSWHEFQEKMKTVENVDEVLAVHQNFIDSCLKNCMLTDGPLLKHTSKLFKVCIKFCDFIQVSLSERWWVILELNSPLISLGELLLGWW